MDLTLNDDELRFRDEVRAFLHSRLPVSLQSAQRTVTSAFVAKPVTQAWLDILSVKGWAAPLWPKEHGGPGWSAVQRYIFESECAASDAPALFPQGVRHVGPLLIRYGTADQQRLLLPRILSGEDYWCQGYSEPAAGSDLANIASRAIREGDEYVVSGSKIWTTDAHHANWIFALLRTSVEQRKQDGLSILTIPMSTPGITVHPIRSINASHELNQVFFDNVRVPVTNRVGEEGKGWECAKYVLEFERGGSFVAARLRRMLVNTLAGRVVSGEAQRDRIAQLHIDIDTLEMMELRLVVGGGGTGRSDAPSILKLRSSQIRQDIARLGVDLAGAAALRWQDAAGIVVDPEGTGVDWSPVSRHLAYRAYTIFAGSSEIQRDIIARKLVPGAK